MMIVDNQFDIGQTCYLKTDPDQLPRLLTGIRVMPNGLIYELSNGITVSSHYDFEISSDKDLINAN